MNPKDMRRLRRGCHDPGIRRVVTTAIQQGTRYRMTKKGVMLYGTGHTAAVAHFTVSDHRGVRNLTSQLRKMGVNV